MKVVIFGLGSIGKRHGKILKSLGHEIAAYRSNANKPLNSLGIKELYSFREVKEFQAKAAFITNPTSLHIPTAIKCAKLGMHLFIEKPLSNNMNDIDRLESICRKNKLTCYTAYCLRFHPVIKNIKQLIKGKKIYHSRITCSSNLADWRRGFDRKQSYSARKAMGGGVLLDLSHEFDYIQYLFGQIKTMVGKYGKVSKVTIDSEDYADIFMNLRKAVCVNLHLDFFSRSRERSIKVDFERGYLIGDLINNKISYFCNEKVKTFKFNLARSSYLEEQTKYFFKNINNPRLMNNLKEARDLLPKIIKFKNGKTKYFNYCCC